MAASYYFLLCIIIKTKFDQYVITCYYSYLSIRYKILLQNLKKKKQNFYNLSIEIYEIRKYIQKTTKKFRRKHL